MYLIKESELLNFTDGNTISSAKSSGEKLLETLQRESQIGADWFKK